MEDVTLGLAADRHECPVALDSMMAPTTLPKEPLENRPHVTVQRVNDPPHRWSARLAAEWLPLLALLLLAVLVALPNLHSSNIDDLDSAHHLMDGYFFRDLLHDHPHHRLGAWAMSYYKQYPALGFIFWPPLFPAVLGIFCTVLGANVLAGRVCLLFFGMVFTAAFYVLLRRQAPRWIAFCGAAACITCPGLIWSFNQIMLELPTLAMMCLALLAYLHLRDRVAAPSSIPRALLTAAALAAVIYTKQPAWFLYLAIALDVVCTPGLLRKREAWIAIAAFVVFVLPLAAFTMKFGHANLAQSVGSNTKLIMSNYEALPRWSLAAWSFYPKLALTLLPPVVLVFALIALGLSVKDRGFRRRNVLWISWLLFFYVTFSFYDNRLPRHATFWWPAWVALATAAFAYLCAHASRTVALIAPLALLIPIPLYLGHARHNDFSDFHEQLPIVASLFQGGASPGNVLLLGPDKQTYVALIRQMDNSRQVHVLRGESLLETGLTLAQICQRYQIGEILVEVPPASASPAAADDAAPRPDNVPGVSRVATEHFRRRGDDVTVLLYRYSGPRDSTMAGIPLSKRLL